MPRDASSGAESAPDPYRQVVLVLLAASILGFGVANAGGLALRHPVVADAAVAFWVAAGILLGVARAQSARAGLEPASEPPSDPALEPPLLRRVQEAWLAEIVAVSGGVGALVRFLASGPGDAAEIGTASAALSAGVVFGGAGLAATAARYLAAADRERFPEAWGLSCGARLLGWVLVLTGVSIGLAWAGSAISVQAIHLLVLALEGWVCVDLFRAKHVPGRFPTELKVFAALGGRGNPLASLHDAAQRQLGIDLRSTWALSVVRRSAEPLLVALAAVGWLSTGATVVGLEEQGVIERLGVATGGPLLAPGLHLHWPWPVDRVVRVPAQRIHTLGVGHEGEEEPGPEDVLWARQHASSEYTLLLGDGRDLIAIDAAVQFRISDPRAWLYRSQNPADALRAVAYRAVMQATVGRTLEEALSENVSRLTAEMRAAVQADADALSLGVEVVGFTVGGMHPPVRVAVDYQAVGSAELGRTTAAIDAQAYRNAVVPQAEAEVVARANQARAEAAQARGKALGEAFGFGALEAEYRAAPGEYRFRRRLETLERGLAGRRFTVLDVRIQRDGGELWLTK
jgi:regulator of protease activity HflC (stomatin/prohibitin superfamily)